MRCHFTSYPSPAMQHHDLKKAKSRERNRTMLSKQHWSSGPAPILWIRNLEGKLGLAGFADLPDLPLYVFPDLVLGHDFVIEVIRIVNIRIFCEFPISVKRCFRRATQNWVCSLIQNPPTFSIKLCLVGSGLCRFPLLKAKPILET